MYTKVLADVDSIEWMLFGVLIFGAVYSFYVKKKAERRFLTDVGRFKLLLNHYRYISSLNAIFAIFMVMGYLLLEKYYELFVLYALFILISFFRLERSDN
jgi:hypothetical protein